MHEHEHSHDHGCGYSRHAGLTEAQADFLYHLEHHHFLPVARFLVESSVEDDFCSQALAPVYLRHPGEGLEAVRETAALLLELERAGLITLDYDCPLEGYDYAEYRDSELFAYFCRTVEEGKGRPGFLGDTPFLELGSIAPAQEE